MRKSAYVVSVVVALVAALAGTALGAGPALAGTGHRDVGQNDVVGAVPAAWTPWINNGQTHSITQVGNTMVVGGTFTSVSASGGSPTLTRNHIVAFDATTGAISSAFAPNVNGSVESLLPGPTSSTVYVGGAFTQINGQPANHLALLDLTTGQAVSSFAPPAITGAVNAMEVSAGRLFIGGYFTKVGGQPHGGLATLNPTNGHLDPYMNVQLAQHHNTTGSGNSTAVGTRSFDINSDGSRMIVVGNFRTADGLPRDQVAMINLTGPTAVVQPDWETTRYTPLCFSWAFDSDVRQVRFAPNGNWFVINATGGHNAGTLCDTSSRFETYATGTNLQPTWVDDAGGDTVWGLAITDKVVYVGGHQRWLNNSSGSDFAGEGAVPRPGLAALDATSGVPLAWNPGRNPRGAGAYCLFVSPTGLWVGSDTPYIGNYKYKRPRIAYFPLADGYGLPSTTTPTLPGNVFLGGPIGGAGSNVLYRVDAGGPQIGAIDNGPDWAADTSGSPSPYHNSGSNTADWDPIQQVNSSVPSTTPWAIFDHERWAPNDNPAMEWQFPVTAGTDVEVRLYFANRYSGTSQPGQRVFNVDLDGTRVLDHYDIVADVGDQTGEMKAFDVQAPGNGIIDIKFTHDVENPLINGIEIINEDVPPPPPNDGLSTIAFDGTTAGTPTQVDNGGISWGTVRGAFMLGSTLFYATSDGSFYERSFDGSTFGAATKIDPYHDPVWDGVNNGSGGTYDGTPVQWYSQLSSQTAMFYWGGRIYYTLAGDSALHYRWFTPDSGIVGSDGSFTASGGLNWSDISGMFLNNNTLYFVKRSTGALWSVPFTNGAPSGVPVDVNDPTTGGDNWNARAVFMGPTPPPNQLPVAEASTNCPNLTCTFDGSNSYDPDGNIVSYAWTFGDGGSSSDEVATHTYSLPGDYNYTLTVTDNNGGTDQTSGTVTVSNPSSSSIQFSGVDGGHFNSMQPSVTVPGATQPGDLLLLVANVDSDAANVSDPSGSGWTLLGTADPNNMQSMVWWKYAAAGDAGSTVSVPMDRIVKSTLEVLDYTGVNATQPIDTFNSAIDNTSSASHTTPTVQATSGDWVVSLWADKSSSTTQWTAPSGVTVRDTQYGTGTGYSTTLTADSGGGVGSVTYGGLTATTDQPGSKAAMWTIALAD